MDGEETLVTRVRRVTACKVDSVSHITDAHTSEEIEEYVNGSDADIHALIDDMKKSTMSRAGSPGAKWNSQGQSSDAFEGTQAASAGQIETSQIPGSPSGSSSVPADGMRDPGPSWNSQAQSSGTSVGIQSATAGPISTLQIPNDKSTGLKEHSPSSSVQGCSNVTGYLPSTSRSWPATCHFYISRRGFCKKGFSCEFCHGFGSSGKLEMEIRQLLLMAPCRAVFLEHLPFLYSKCYKKHLPLPVGDIRNPYSLQTLLRPLHTISWSSDSFGQKFLLLLENYPVNIGYPAALRNWDVLNDEETTQIYITYSTQSIPICTGENVYYYFRNYGPVLSVTIPPQSTFGFVRFQYPWTVRLLLSEWNPRVPHFIFGEEVRVRRYIPKGEANLNNNRNTSAKHGLETAPGIVTKKNGATSAPEIAPPLTHSQPSHSQMEIDPLEGGEAAASPDGGSADHSQPSQSQAEIDHPEVLIGGQVLGGLAIDPVEGGQVPGGLDGDLADEQNDDDEIVARLPDVSCFYKKS